MNGAELEGLRQRANRRIIATRVMRVLEGTISRATGPITGSGLYVARNQSAPLDSLRVILWLVAASVARPRQHLFSSSTLNRMRAAMLQGLRTFLFANTTTKQTVAKNTIWLSVSQIGGVVIRSVIIVYAARVLGTAEYGIFSYAVTLAGFMNTLMDPGVNSVLIRDIAKSSEHERGHIFSAALAIKTALIVIGSGAIIFAAPYFSVLPGAKSLLPFAGLILTFDSFREFLVSVLRATENIEWEAAIAILANAAIVTFGFICLGADRSAKSLAFGYTVGTGIGVIASIIVLKGYLPSVIRDFSFRQIASILHSAWPFAISGALGILLTNADILIISWMKTASDVGVYSATIRVI